MPLLEKLFFALARKINLLRYGLDFLGLQHNGAWYYPQTDALGSIRQWTNASGAVVGSTSDDPFGGLLSRPGFTSPWGGCGGVPRSHISIKVIDFSSP